MPIKFHHICLRELRDLASVPTQKIQTATLQLIRTLTEGQGFYQGRKKYKLKQFSLPIGGGVQWAITDNFRVGFVVGIRPTFTDYLDDVSTTYIDEDLLRTRRGGVAVNYAYRGDELPDGALYPVDGTQRGNPKNKDWYYFSGLTARIRLQTKSYRKQRPVKPRRASVACPPSL